MISPPHRQSVAQISQNMEILQASLNNWRKYWRLPGDVVPASEKDPQSQTIPTGHSAAKKKPANGFPLLWIGTTTSTAIAALNALGHSKGIAVRLLRSAATVPASMS